MLIIEVLMIKSLLCVVFQYISFFKERAKSWMVYVPKSLTKIWECFLFFSMGKKQMSKIIFNIMIYLLTFFTTF